MKYIWHFDRYRVEMRVYLWGTYSRESWMPRDDLWKTFDLCSPILCSLRDQIGSFEGLLRVGSLNEWCVRSLFLAIECLSDVKNVKKKILETPFFSGPTQLIALLSLIFTVNLKNNQSTIEFKLKIINFSRHLFPF